MKNGILAAAGAYFWWGLSPIFWKVLKDVPPQEILGHRVIWSVLLLIAVLLIRQNWNWLKDLRKNPRNGLVFLLSGTLLGTNWIIFIWAVNTGHVVDVSLGYFINPLFSVLLGVVFLKERLRNGQLAAILIALTGVIYLTVSFGALPWIALSLAFTFGLYGLLRKTAKIGALEGLSLEMLVMLIPAIVYVGYLQQQGAASFGSTWILDAALIFTSVMTVVPLFLFAYGARKIPLTLVGILQYMAPTLQFLLGVFLYNEAFTQTSLIGYSIIWAALIIYSLEGFYVAGRKRALAESN